MLLRWVNLTLTCCLLASCGGDGENNPAERSIPAGGVWYEADFKHAPDLAAEYHHTIILDLEPASYMGEPLENLLRYRLDTGTYRFCIDPDDELITGFTLENKAGEVVVQLDLFSECSELELPAGIYTKRIRHNGDEIMTRATQVGETPQSRVAFVQAQDASRVTDQNGQPRGGWWAIVPNAESSRIISALPPGDYCGPDDYPYPVPCPSKLGGVVRSAISSAQLFRFDHLMGGATVPVAMQPGVINKTVPSPLFVFFNFASSSLSAHTRDNATTACAIDVYGRAAGYLLATQGASALNSACETGTLVFNDLGDYTFQFYVLEPYGSPPTKAGVYFLGDYSLEVLSGRGWEPATLKTLFRLFRPQDGDDTAEISRNLPEGEVALFEDCNYGGKMWVLGEETPDFSTLSGPGFELDNAISSIRVGQDTTAILYSGSAYQGTRQEFIADTPCLQGTSIGDNTASALQFGHAIDVLISSNQCVGCKLAGVDLQQADLRGVDLRQADLRGANLFKAKLRKAKFNDALLSGSDTNLNFTELRQADLTGADLSHASLEGADLRQAVLAYTVLTDAKLTGAHIYQIGDSHLDLTLATLDGADFSGALMAQVKLSGSIKNAKFNRAVLVNAEFDNSVLDETTFNGAWLAGVNFTGASSVRNTHLTNACVSIKEGTWNFPELQRSYGYKKTVLGVLATDTSVFCPNGSSGTQCCPSGDVASCDARLLKPQDAPDADLSQPNPPPCLPDPAVLDDPAADESLLCPPPQSGVIGLQNCSNLQ